MAAKISDMCAAAQAGDRHARDKLLRHYIRYVQREVAAAQRPDIAEDLFQAGLIGIDRAITKHDLTRGTSLMTTVGYWVKHEMQIERRRHDSDGFTGRNLKRGVAVARARAQGRAVPKDAARTEAEADRAEAAAQPIRRGAAMRAHLREPNAPDVFRLIDGEKALAALEALPERQRLCVFGVYVEDRDVSDLSAELGVSKQTVRNDCKRGLARLRRALG